MELRWYWRVLQRQWHIIVATMAVVAFVAAGYTAYTSYVGFYKTQTVLQFAQEAPIYQTANVYIDPIGAALGNAGTATAEAKYYTTELQFPKALQAYVLRHDNQKVDWKVIRSRLGANTTAPRALEMEYTASSQGVALDVINAAVAVLTGDFLPDYNRTALRTPPGSKVQEFPITMRTVDPPITITLSLTGTAFSWFTKVVAGAVLGIVLAYLREYLDEAIHDEQDVLHWMHTPTLGALPN